MKKILLRCTSILFMFPAIVLPLYILICMFIYTNVSMDYRNYLNNFLIEITFLLLSTLLFVLSLDSPKARYRMIRITLWYCFGLYLFALFGILFLETSRTIRLESITTIFQGNNILGTIKSNSNFIPFYSIIEKLNNPSYGSFYLKYALKLSFANLLLFCPMGILLPCLFQKTQKWHIFILTMLLSLFVVESIQLIFLVGSFDIDDIIFNFIGAFLVYLLTKIPFIQKLLVRLYLSPNKTPISKGETT